MMLMDRWQFTRRYHDQPHPVEFVCESSHRRAGGRGRCIGHDHDVAQSGVRWWLVVPRAVV
jgi:hypothetical protein